MGVSRQVCRRAHGLRLCRFSPRFCQARRLDWGAALFVRLLSACLVLSELPELSSVLFRLFAEHSDDCLRRGMGEARPCPWICRDKCGEASFRAGRKGGDWEGRRIADVLLWLALCWLLPRFWGSASGAQRAVASAEGGCPSLLSVETAQRAAMTSVSSMLSKASVSSESRPWAIALSWL